MTKDPMMPRVMKLVMNSSIGRSSFRNVVDLRQTGKSASAMPLERRPEPRGKEEQASRRAAGTEARKPRQATVPVISRDSMQGLWRGIHTAACDRVRPSRPRGEQAGTSGRRKPDLTKGRIRRLGQGFPSARINAANRICSWLTIQTAVRLPMAGNSTAGASATCASAGELNRASAVTGIKSPNGHSFVVLKGDSIRACFFHCAP
jgi:hypothetical protein